ncbi:MAG TPA: hypothetical protein VF469_27070 [Kofleriaceae bacterium]
MCGKKYRRVSLAPARDTSAGVAQPVDVIDTALDLLVHGQRELDRLGRHGADDQFANRGVERRPDDALAERIAERATAADAHVDRDVLERPSSALAIGSSTGRAATSTTALLPLCKFS